MYDLWLVIFFAKKLEGFDLVIYVYYKLIIHTCIYIIMYTHYLEIILLSPASLKLLAILHHILFPVLVDQIQGPVHLYTCHGSA